MSILADIGGDFPPFMLWHAETGELSYRPFDEVAGERVAKNIELGSSAAKFALDIGTVERGWAKVRLGSRDVITSPVGSPPPAQPAEDYKPAVSLAAWNPILDELRIETSTTIFRNAICFLLDRCFGFDEAVRGLVPVVLFADRRERAFRSLGKTFWSPTIDIIGWAERERVPAFRCPRTVPAPTAAPSLEEAVALPEHDDAPARHRLLKGQRQPAQVTPSR
jgi:hypothetical protein